MKCSRSLAKVAMCCALSSWSEYGILMARLPCGLEEDNNNLQSAREADFCLPPLPPYPIFTQLGLRACGCAQGNVRPHKGRKADVHECAYTLMKSQAGARCRQPRRAPKNRRDERELEQDDAEGGELAELWKAIDS